MRGKLDRDGHLHIDRRGVFKQQDCRLSTGWFRAEKGIHEGKMTPAGLPCTDHCPLMGEPVNTEMGVLLSLCHGRTLQFDELEDLRDAGSVPSIMPSLPMASLPLTKQDK